MTGSWKKPQALQLYHGLLQRYRDWDEDGSAGNEGAAEEVEVAVYRYSSDEDDSDGSGSEIIEFVTPRVRGGTCNIECMFGDTHWSCSGTRLIEGGGLVLPSGPG